MAVDTHGKYAEYVAIDQGNTGTYTQMFPEHWDVDNFVNQAVDSAGKVTKIDVGQGNGWDSYSFSGEAEMATTSLMDAQIDDIVIFDEAIGYFAVETLYDSGNARPPTELQNPSYGSYWALNGVGTDAEKLASGIVNAQPPPNPNTSSESV